MRVKLANHGADVAALVPRWSTVERYDVLKISNLEQKHLLYSTPYYRAPSDEATLTAPYLSFSLTDGCHHFRGNPHVRSPDHAQRLLTFGLADVEAVIANGVSLSGAETYLVSAR